MDPYVPVISPGSQVPPALLHNKKVISSPVSPLQQLHQLSFPLYEHTDNVSWHIFSGKWKQEALVYLLWCCLDPFTRRDRYFLPVIVMIYHEGSVFLFFFSCSSYSAVGATLLGFSEWNDRRIRRDWRDWAKHRVTSRHYDSLSQTSLSIPTQNCQKHHENL